MSETIEMVNPLYNAFAAFEAVYSALPAPIKLFILLVSMLFAFTALFSIFRG